MLGGLINFLADALTNSVSHSREHVNRNNHGGQTLGVHAGPAQPGRYLAVEHKRGFFPDAASPTGASYANGHGGIAYAPAGIDPLRMRRHIDTSLYSMPALANQSSPWSPQPVGGPPPFKRQVANLFAPVPGADVLGSYLSSIDNPWNNHTSGGGAY